MSYLEGFKQFFKPDDFKAKPYGYLTNQLGHVFLGFALATTYTYLVYKFGVYPDQTLVFFTVCVFYFVCIELSAQGWRKWDTLEDTFYTSMGSSVYLFIHMEWVIERIFGFLVLLAIPLLIGTLARMGEVDNDK